MVSVSPSKKNPRRAVTKTQRSAIGLAMLTGVFSKAVKKAIVPVAAERPPIIGYITNSLLGI